VKESNYRTYQWKVKERSYRAEQWKDERDKLQDISKVKERSYRASWQSEGEEIQNI
jgi:hypothetical protein